MPEKQIPTWWETEPFPQSAKESIKRTVEYLINCRDNNAVPVGVTLPEFGTTIQTLYSFLIAISAEEALADDK